METCLICLIQSALDISNPEGIGETARDSQHSRYRGTDLKKKKSPDIPLQLYFHITNDISSVGICWLRLLIN